jgi:hypothetical protein
MKFLSILWRSDTNSFKLRLVILKCRRLISNIALEMVPIARNERNSDFQSTTAGTREEVVDECESIPLTPWNSRLRSFGTRS